MLHRHIGGLEIVNIIEYNSPALHRHIGGLETNRIKPMSNEQLHRHIGGLEKKITVLKITSLSSPPHRRLRNKHG